MSHSESWTCRDRRTIYRPLPDITSSVQCSDDISSINNCISAHDSRSAHARSRARSRQSDLRPAAHRHARAKRDPCRTSVCKRQGEQLTQQWRRHPRGAGQHHSMENEALAILPAGCECLLCCSEAARAYACPMCCQMRHVRGASTSSGKPRHVAQHLSSKWSPVMQVCSYPRLRARLDLRLSPARIHSPMRIALGGQV